MRRRGQAQRRPRRREVLESTWRSYLYGGSDRSVTLGGPYLRDGVSVQRYLAPPFIVALLAALLSVYFYGWHVAAVIAAAWASGLAIALAFCWVRGKPLTEGVFLTVLLYSLLLPPALPLWLVALGAAVAVASRELFGGLGHNVFHPALVGKAFLIAVFPAPMSRWAEPLAGGWGGFLRWAPQALTDQTPLVAAREGMEVAIGPLFLGTVPGALGTTSALFLIVAGAWLLTTRAIDRRIVLALIATVAIGQALLGMMFPEAFRGSWAVHVLSGGLLFMALLVATDPVTSPMTPRGKWIYAVAIGLLVIFLRALTPDPEGVTFSVLIVNLFVPLLDRYTVPRTYGGGKSIAERPTL